jgi:hypothetical protein
LKNQLLLSEYLEALLLVLPLYGDGEWSNAADLLEDVDLPILFVVVPVAVRVGGVVAVVVAGALRHQHVQQQQQQQQPFDDHDFACVLKSVHCRVTDTAFIHPPPDSVAAVYQENTRLRAAVRNALSKWTHQQAWKYC